MKTLRNHIFISACCVLIITGYFCCGTKEKISVSSKNELRLRDKILLGESAHDSLGLARVIHVRDSSDQSYQMRIFPVDTFTFSLQNGYQGKASLIEISGIRKQLLTGRDSIAVYSQNQVDREYERETEDRKTSVIRTREIRKWNIRLIWAVIVLGVLGLGFWVCRRS